MNKSAGGTNKVCAFKQLIERQTVKPAAPPQFVPLKVKPHPRVEEMQRYAAIPSRYSK